MRDNSLFRESLLRRFVFLGGMFAIATAASVGPVFGNRTLDFVDVLVQGDNGAEGLTDNYSVTISPDQKSVYCTGVAESIISAHSLDPVTGVPTQIQSILVGPGGTPEPFTSPVSALISEDQKHLYLCAWGSDLLVIYDRDTTTGLLTENDQLIGGDIQGLAYLDDTTGSEYIYGVNVTGDSVVGFQRNSMTGGLTVVDVVDDSDLPEPALDEVVYIRVAPDDNHLYVVSGKTNSLTILEIDSNDGTLSFVDTIYDGEGISDFTSPRWIDITEDGKFVYVTAYYSQTIKVFERNLTSGLLTEVDSFTDNTRLDGTRCVVISPDQKTVLANGYNSNTLVQLERDTLTGELTFVEEYQNLFQPGAVGLSEVRDIIFSPDGEYVYLASWADDSIATLKFQPELLTIETWRIY